MSAAVLAEPPVYEDQNLSPSQRADLARHTLSALRSALARAGWVQTRVDRWEKTPGAGPVVETNYVYGETRAKLWATSRSIEPVDVFRFFGRPQDHTQMESFLQYIGA